MVCEHLSDLEQALIESRIKETYRGQAWGEETREWVYFDCVLDLNSLRERFQIKEFVVTHENLDPRSGTESGFFCTKCLDAIMGRLPSDNADIQVFK